MSVSKRFRTLACALIAGAGISIAIPSTAAATPGQGRGNGKGNPEKVEIRSKAKGPKYKAKKAKAVKTETVQSKPIVRTVAGERDYYTIRTQTTGDGAIMNRYFSTQGLPPGLAGGPLPAGLRNQLRERGELPPGLQSRLVSVPAPLARQLSPLAPYFSRYLLGRDLVVVDTRNNIVALVRGNVITLR